MSTRTDPRWLEQGACRQHPDVDFFAADEGTQREPLAICAGCAVRAVCLEHALAGHELGIWGGTTERARARMRRSRRRMAVAAPDLAETRASASNARGGGSTTGEEIAEAS
jgi:WhiB family transcriptional regulator, redox-sensing transcriptional regulator